MKTIRISFYGYTEKAFEQFKLLIDRMNISYFAGEDWLEIEEPEEIIRYVEILLELSQVGEIVGKWD